MIKLFVSAVVAVGLSIVAADANPLTFEGAAALENVTSACAADGLSADQYYIMTYSYANDTSGAVDSLALITARGAMRFASTDSSGSLNGTVSTYDTTITGRAALFNYNDTVSLSISTLGGNPLSSAVNVKVIGTLNDVFATTGCNLTIHGLLVVRPSQ